MTNDTLLANGYQRKGYLKKKCNSCCQQIYLKLDSDLTWRPYESWVAGTCPKGEWVLHQCQDNDSIPAVPC